MTRPTVFTRYPKIAVNLSMLFTEFPFLERFGQAADAGFKGVECQFPYEWDPHAIRDELNARGLEMVMFNLPAGNWAAGERGIACHPDRQQEFREGVDHAIAYARVLGNRMINCLAGVMPADVSAVLAHDTFIENLAYAAAALEQVDIRLLIEAINTRDVPGFFLHGSDQALVIREMVGSDNLFLQYDAYHMQVMEGDLALTIERNLSHIAHIQIADNPGRHEPGTGEINYGFLLSQIAAIGYQGWISLEYLPNSSTEAGLKGLKDWLLD
ncbi:hydroxypyruvate isomerase [Allohahella marinimesophila]|uniref:Hydroxypyruvate isomerase n=1 Tax=Allohahella marinimesophila TaxID=1054972 RepID=A0ABP7NPU0_9GAMM